eukprot:6491687-Amphidinium_carterae.2
MIHDIAVDRGGGMMHQRRCVIDRCGKQCIGSCYDGADRTLMPRCVRAEASETRGSMPNDDLLALTGGSTSLRKPGHPLKAGYQSLSCVRRYARVVVGIVYTDIVIDPSEIHPVRANCEMTGEGALDLRLGPMGRHRHTLYSAVGHSDMNALHRFFSFMLPQRPVDGLCMQLTELTFPLMGACSPSSSKMELWDFFI